MSPDESQSKLQSTPMKCSPSKSKQRTVNKVSKTPSPIRKRKNSLQKSNRLYDKLVVTHLATPPMTGIKAQTPTKRNETFKEEINPEYKNIKTPKKALTQNLLDLDLEKSGQKLQSPKRSPSPRRKKSPATILREFRYRPPPNTVFDLQEYLDDLKIRDLKEDMEDNDYKFLKQKILNSKKIVVVTGAGISVASGIPDFRSQDGIFNKLKEKTSQENDDINVSSGKDLFDFNFIYSSPKALSLFNDMVYDLHTKIKSTSQTDFHTFIDNLAKKKNLKRCYTQNVDGFENHLDSLNIKHPLSEKKQEWPNVIQLHGSINHLHCIKCRKIYDIEQKHFLEPEQSEEEIQLSDLLPNCPECEEAENIRALIGKRSQGVGKLRSNIILYNEEHPESEGIGRVVESDILSSCDLLIVCGTTLKIPGVKRIVREFSRSIQSKKEENGNGGAIIWMGNELPSQGVVDYVEFIDMVVLGDCQKFAKMTTDWFTKN
ncbi:hypothetical protein QEN19_001950 [Hanseniaspora menglaensis]